MMIRGTAMNSPSSRSIPELFSDAVGQLAKLVGNEFDLARAELSEKARQAGKAVGMIGAGGGDLDSGISASLIRVFGSIDPQRAFRTYRLFNSGFGRGAAFGGIDRRRNDSSFRGCTQAYSYT